ncbi:MAG: hypothetical protein IPL61_40555 [Myxococcales bacterium]|nr:hypothetical protein [Myxococcales bacterium]
MTQVPTARTVKHRGVMVTPPGRPLGERIAAALDRLEAGPRAFVAAVIGLRPVTAVVAVGLGMCWAAVIGNGP